MIVMEMVLKRKRIRKKKVLLLIITIITPRTLCLAKYCNDYCKVQDLDDVEIVILIKLNDTSDVLCWLTFTSLQVHTVYIIVDTIA